MSVNYWPVSLPQGPAPGFDFSPQDVLTTFDPVVGTPLSRPRTTASPFMTEMEWLLQDDQIATFHTFFHTTLAQGSQTFVMRDVTNCDVRWWRFLGPYSRSILTRAQARVRARVMMLPGTPWFADYVPAGVSRVPYFVADYANAVYGIDGETVAAADLLTIAGTYLVERTTTTAVTTATETLVATDIPATAPGTTTKIIGFAP